MASYEQSYRNMVNPSMFESVMISKRKMSRICVFYSREFRSLSDGW